MSRAKTVVTRLHLQGLQILINLLQNNPSMDLEGLSPQLQLPVPLQPFISYLSSISSSSISLLVRNRVLCLARGKGSLDNLALFPVSPSPLPA